MTHEEYYMNVALAEMRKAQWPPEKWCTAIQDGYPLGHEYNWMVTHNYLAQQAMWNAAHPNPQPVPPPPVIPPVVGHPVGNRCLYFSTVDQDTVNWVASLGRFGHGLYTALFSADLNLGVPGGPYWADDAQVRMLNAAGIIVASWSDCSATPYSHALALAKRPGFAFAGGQAEDQAQYLQAIGSGATHIVGNPNNLGASLSDAINRTAKGEIAFIGEILHPDPGYSAQGVSISSGCMYVDMDEEHGGYQPLASFDVMPAGLKAGASIYTAGKMSAADRALYEQWTKP